MSLTTIEDLVPMLEQAEAEDLHFYQPHFHIWLTPGELRRGLAEGRFLWPPKHWQLRPESDRRYSKCELNDMLCRIGGR